MLFLVTFHGKVIEVLYSFFAFLICSFDSFFSYDPHSSAAVAAFWKVYLIK